MCEWVEHLANLEEELHALTSQIEERRAAGRPAKRHQMTLRELMSRAHHKQNEVNQWRRSAIGVATCLGPEDVAILCTYAPLSVQSFAAHAQSNISNEGTET